MSIFQEKKVSITLALIVMLVGTFAYIILDPQSKMSSMNRDVARLYGNIDFKVAFTEDGAMKVFAYVNNDGLSRFKISEGSKSVSEGMILGYAEAQMMLEESLIDGVGSELNNFFGINTKVSGILVKTDTFIDDTHFLNKAQFGLLGGYDNVVIMKLTDNDEPKLFFLLDRSDEYPFMSIMGSDMLSNYDPNNINGEYYYPVILGAAEAEMMIEENLITGEGSILKGFFGRNVVIIGILPKTDTAMDMMHFVPKDFFNYGVLV
jgi:hypothetical protein